MKCEIKQIYKLNKRELVELSSNDFNNKLITYVGRDFQN